MPLSDRQLKQLLTMVREADEADALTSGRTVQPPSAVPHHPHPHRPHSDQPLPFVRPRAGAPVRWAAAAAGLLLAGLALRALLVPAASPVPADRSIAPPGPGAAAGLATRHESAHAAATGALPSPAGEQREFALLAIVPDEAGRLQCVEWSSERQTRSLADLGVDEMRQLGIGLLCQSDARQVLVVGIEGPRHAMPSTDEHAAEIARCILYTPHRDLPGEAEVCNPGTCMPTTVRMRMESIALRN